MEGGSQSHSPHYHFLHYAEIDPLMDHTRIKQVSHRKRRDRKANGKEGRQVNTQVGRYVWVSAQKQSTQNPQTQ